MKKRSKIGLKCLLPSKPFRSPAPWENEKFLSSLKAGSLLVAIASFQVILAFNLLDSELDFSGAINRPPFMALLSGILFFCVGAGIIGYTFGRWPTIINLYIYAALVFGTGTLIWTLLFWPFESGTDVFYFDLADNYISQIGVGILVMSLIYLPFNMGYEKWEKIQNQEKR